MFLLRWANVNFEPSSLVGSIGDPFPIGREPAPVVINCVAMNWKGLPSPAIDSMGNRGKPYEIHFRSRDQSCGSWRMCARGASSLARSIEILMSGECGSAITV